MTELNCDLAVAQAIALIKSYSFDTNGDSAEKLVQKWLNSYQENWVRLAAIEALYLGRYKTVSIEQIMAAWLRIGMPNIHFKGEFERLICRKLPKHLVISNSFWFDSEESPVRHQNSNSAPAKDRQSNILLISASSPQTEPVTTQQNLPKTLSQVKNLLRQRTTKYLLSDSPLNEQATPVSSTVKQEQPDHHSLESYHLTKSEEAEGLIPSSHLSLLSRGDGTNGDGGTPTPRPSSLGGRSQVGETPTGSFTPHSLVHRFNGEVSLTSHSPTITNFNPIPDNSAFFHKLKSLALNLE
ncbi:MAG: hypothetical protein AB4372_31465 [Xenococcus sp. (in: cyanobacteria)]